MGVSSTTARENAIKWGRGLDPDNGDQARQQLADVLHNEPRLVAYKTDEDLVRVEAAKNGTATSPEQLYMFFGTNEGFAPQEQLGDYAGEFRERLLTLHRAAPGASIVIVGPPDANRLPGYCGRNIGDKRPCVPLSRAEAASYSSLLASNDRKLCRWHTPAAVDYVRQAQQQVARQLNMYFWNWAAVQGGTCGADRWARQEQRHVQRDDPMRLATLVFPVP